MKIRPQILVTLIALTAIAYFVLALDGLSSEVKGTLIGGSVTGIVAIGKDLVQLDKDKD